jgi:hydroxymethylglutaryl-CoA synthase
MKKVIGIDSIGVFVPRLFVDLTGEWAQVRAPVLTQGDVHKLVGKVTDGVGVTRMAIPDAHQDCATMAAMAAKRAIDAAQIDPRDIDYLAVGTETTVDQSKSTAAYVLGMLERHYGVSMAEAGAPQFQFACIGATYALEAAASRIRAGDNLKPYSLVIASDVSKYPLCTAGEYTQGAGAVALLLSENPRILALEHGLSATVTRDERDFFRPNWSGAAVVDGKYSVDVYLDCVESAFLAYANRLKGGPGVGESGVLDAIDHFLFHVPFPRMAEYAAARVFTTQWLGARQPAGAGLLASLAEQVPMIREQHEEREKTDKAEGSARKWRRDLEREVAKSAIFRELYDQKVAPSLSLARSVGNVYSGALYLSLAGLLERSRSRSLVGERAAFTSYGSGASAKVFSGIFQEGYAAVTAGLRTQEDLRVEAEGGTRVPLSMMDYERLHGLTDCELDGDEKVVQKLRDGLALSAPEVAALRSVWTKPAWRIRPRGASVRPPSAEFALDRLGTQSSADRTDLGYRYYTWVPAHPKDPDSKEA